jgi:hypothetical protein
VPIPSYDRGFKIIAHDAGRRLAGMAKVTATAWRPVVSEIQAVERLADRAFRATHGREQFVVYFEAYTYWEQGIAWGLQAKAGLLSERERVPTICVVFFLRPDGYQPQPGGTFRLEALGGPTQQVWLREVPLWEEVPDASWEDVPGLMALYPLCRHGKTPRQAVAHAAAAIGRARGSARRRADLLTVLGIFGRLAYPDLDTFALIGREQMKESPAYQEIMDEGRVEQGRAYILMGVEERFGKDAAEQLRADVQTIEDLTRLERLMRLAFSCPDLNTFREALRAEMPPRRRSRRRR